MKKIFILLFALLSSVTMFAQQERMQDPTMPVSIQNVDIGSMSRSIDDISGPTRAPGVTLFCEGFEGSTYPPTGWTLYGTPSTTLFLRYTTGGRTEPACIGFPTASSTYPTRGITTPSFVSAPGMTVTFWVKQSQFYGSSSYYNAYRIKVSTTTNAQTAFTTIKEYSTFDYTGINPNKVIYTVAANAWYEMTADLSAYAGQTIYVAIESYDRYGADGVYIDDICVGTKSDNDLAVTSAPYPYKQVPQNQTLASSLAATIVNNGAQAQSNVQLDVHLNGTLQGTSPAHPSLAPNANVTLTAPTLSPTIAIGNYSLTYTAKQTQIDDNPDNNVITRTFAGTKNKYSVDNGNWNTYMAGTATATYGNIFTFSKPTTIHQIEGEFYWQSGLTTSNNFSVSIREVTGTNTISSTILYSQTGISKPNNAVSMIVHTLATPLQLPAGSYYVAFYGANINVLGETNADGRIGYSATTTGTALTPLVWGPCLRLYVDPYQNDLVAIANGFPYTMIPAPQAPLLPFPTTLSARAVNAGTSAQTNVKTLVTYNGTPFPTSAPIATLASGATSAVMNVTPPAGTLFPTALGTYNVDYNVSSDQTENYPSDNTQTYPFEITDGLFAIDGVGASNFRGVGYTTADYGLGNLFTVTKTAVINQVKIAFSESSTGVQNYNVVLYKRTGTSITGTALFTQSAYRAAAEGWVTVNVPSTLLMPDDYFLFVQQSTANNIGVAYDGVPGRLCYGYTGVVGLVEQTNFGSLGIRMVLEEPKNIDMQAISIIGPKMVPALDQVTYTVQVRNLGSTVANNFTVNVLNENNVLLGTANVTAANLALGDVTTVNVPSVFQISMKGVQNIKGQVVIPGDQVPGNNETPLFAVTVVDECAGAPEIYTLATGTTNTYNVPINTFYGYSYTQQIYDASLINIPAGTKIASIALQYIYSIGQVKNNQTIYLGNTTKSTFTSTTDWIPVSQLQEVYTGPINYNNSSEWLEIIFNNTFEYTGGNIVVVFLNNHGSYSTSSNPTFRFHTAASKTIHYRADGTTPLNPASPPTATNITVNERNNIRFIGLGIKEFSIDYEVVGDGEVNVVLNPDPFVCGSTATVTITPANDCTAITDIKFDGVSQPLQTTYVFEDQNVPLPFITIDTDFPFFTINVTHSANGSVVPGGSSFTVECGSDHLFQFLPDMGYMVNYVEVDGVVLPKSMNDYYAFDYVIAHHTLHVEFKEAPLTIYFSHESAGGGKVIPVGKELQIPYGQIGVDYGDMQQFLFIPQTNYVLQAVYIDGVYNALATNTGSYFFFNLLTNHIVHAVFVPVNFNIFASAGTGGNIYPPGNNSVPYNTDMTFTISANTGYVIDKLYVDNVEVPVATSYTFYNVDANHTIYVTFKIAELVIHMNWNQGGTLYPTGNTYIPTGTYSGDVYVSYNSTQEITFTPQTGYKVTSLVVNGVSYPNYIPTGSYTFYYIKADQTITVTFAKIQYEIVAKADQHSVIVPAGTTMVPHGNNMKYDFYALNGYHLTSVFIDGIDNKPAAAAGTYTFENVAKSHTIDVVAAINTYTISAKVNGNGGYITPAGDTKVNWGANQLYTITTYPGYKITAVLVDGVPNGEAVATGAYVFLNVVKDHTIEVSFELKRFNIVSTASENGLIDPMGITETDYGTDVTFTITPEEGYKVSFVLVNGTNVGEITSYTFYKVEGDGAIDAFFEKVTTGPGGETGIKDPLAEVSVYNQTNIVYIVNKKQVPLQDVSIFDMYGRVVWQGNVYNDVSTITLNVANGIYAVRIATGDQYSTTKISIVR